MSVLRSPTKWPLSSANLTKMPVDAHQNNQKFNAEPSGTHDVKYSTVDTA